MTLRYRLKFERRGLDANGDPLGAWEAFCEVWADVEYQRGSEVAVTNRLIGRQPVSITIRETVLTRDITPAFRATIQGAGARAGEVFNITAVAPGREAGTLNLMGISGVADG